MHVFRKLLVCLAELGQVVMIQGNHDHHPMHDDPETPNDVIFALVELAGIPGVMYLSKSGYYKIDNVGFGLTTVHGFVPHGKCKSGKEEIRDPSPPAWSWYVQRGALPRDCGRLQKRRGQRTQTNIRPKQTFERAVEFRYIIPIISSVF